VLKPAKLKSNVGNNKEGTVTYNNNKTPCYLMTRSHFWMSLLLMGLLPGLEIPSAFSHFP